MMRKGHDRIGPTKKTLVVEGKIILSTVWYLSLVEEGCANGLNVPLKHA